MATPTTSITAVGEILRTVRERRPLVHQITNFVVMNETANATLAIGALPVMAHAMEEVEEMAAVASALVLNIGTLTPKWIDAMVKAGQAANAKGTPIVLDPVGVGATTLRTTSAQRLLDELQIAVIRGNLAEVAALAGQNVEIRGVESIGSGNDAAELANGAAKQLGAVVAITGQVDHVSDGHRQVAISNGHELLASITGSGCISTALVGCALAGGADPFDAAVAGLTFLGIAGERAAVGAEGPGTFHARLYDALAALDPTTIDAKARLFEQ